jgi:hypothetical protein
MCEAVRTDNRRADGQRVESTEQAGPQILTTTPA